jgi:DNA recombination protein RmuC
MIPAVAVLLMLFAVAGCCVYLSYRVGQAISPTFRSLQRRLARVEAAFVRSETSLRQALEHHRESSSEQLRQLAQESAGTLATQVGSLRRPLDDVSDRVNGMRVDLSRDTKDLREEVQDALRSVRDDTRERLSEYSQTHAAALEKISAQIRELGIDDERRHESARASLERIGSDLRDAYATSVSELRGVLTAHLAEARGSLTGIDRRIVEQSVLLEGVDDGLRTALGESERKHESLNGIVEAQLVALRADASHQLAKLVAKGEGHESTWQGLKDDFDALTGSVAQITHAIEVLKNQLTVPLHDPERPIELSALLERILQPDEFERDVEIEPGTNRRVAFGVRLSDNPLTRVWLPIAVLSAIDGYHELLAADVYGDADRMIGGSRTFERSVLAAVQDLNAKFIAPPHTMNLAILFVPTDDLLAEIARRDSLVESLRHDLHVMVAGPATLPTLVTGLRLALRGTRPAAARTTNGNGVRDFATRMRE